MFGVSRKDIQEMKKKEYAVIGLGRFGGSICETLIAQGMSVMAIDKNEDRVNEYTSIATHAVIADCTDENVLKNLGLRNFDHVIVSIGEDLQSSILITLMLKELGVKKVTAKAQNEYHGKVLQKIGTDHVVHPERDMGKRIAHYILSNSILDFLELSNEHSIVEIAISSKLEGRSIIELDIRAKYNINIVAIRRNSEMIITPQPNDTLKSGDVLIVIGAVKDITRFETKFLY